MENLIEAIRNAIASDASDEARAIGAQACRTILIALETPRGEPLEATAAPTATAGEPVAPIHAVVAALRGMPPDQLLDLAIARLKVALPPGTEVSPVRSLNVPLVAVPALTGVQP